MQESMLILMMFLTLAVLATSMVAYGVLLFTKGRDDKAEQDWINDLEKPSPKVMIWQGLALIVIGFAGLNAVVCAAYTVSF